MKMLDAPAVSGRIGFSLQGYRWSSLTFAGLVADDAADCCAANGAQGAAIG